MNGADAISPSASAIAAVSGAVSPPSGWSSLSRPGWSGSPSGSVELVETPAHRFTFAMTSSANRSRCSIFFSSGSVSGPLM